MSESIRLVLASASPRRRELLDQIRIRYRVIVADIDESVLPDELPGDYVRRMAAAKASEVMRRESCSVPVLGADTSVILDDRILGKPRHRTHAIEMLGDLSGREHQVFSAVAVVEPGGIIHENLNITSVTFAEMGSSWIETYCDSGDPMDKAGAYGVQGLAAQKIAHLDGSYSSVMGLPLFETSELLRKAGVLAAG